MIVRIFTRLSPLGFNSRDPGLPPGVMAELAVRGVFMGSCPCCDKPIIVKVVPCETELSNEEKEHLSGK